MSEEAPTVTPNLVPVKSLGKQKYVSKPYKDRPLQRPLQGATASAETTEPLQQDVRTDKVIRRRHRNTEEQDPLYIDPKMIPAGLSVEWKRFSCYGKPDPAYMARLQRQGWEPCPVDKWRFLVGDEYEGKTVDIEGMRLMQRPKELTEEARREDYEIATGQVKNKMQQLSSTPEGQLERKVLKSNVSIGRAAIPEDE